MRFARTAAAIALVFFASAILPAEDKKTKQEKEDFVLKGIDPHGFANAEAMFRRTAVPHAAPAGKKIDELAALLAKRQLPETNDATMAVLRSVESLTDADYSRLRLLAMDAGRTMPRIKTLPPKAIEHMTVGNALYEKGELANAIKEYAAVLRLVPDHLDARNNLGLAEMHLGYDVSAAFHFRLAQALNAKYIGARTNLSVALARLGLSQEAYLTAFFAAKDMPRGPIAQYNMAWFHNARGDYAGAAKAVAFALEASPEYENAKHLRALNETEALRVPSYDGNTRMSSDGRKKLPNAKAAAVVALPGVALHDRGRVAATVTGARQCMISERQQPWVAVYWPDDYLKHRLWLNQEAASAKVAAALTGTWQLKRYGKPWATASVKQVNGALRAGVETHQGDTKDQFDIDSIAVDSEMAKMAIRYRSGERATLKFTITDNLRTLSGTQSPSYAEVVAEKIRD